ncbi:MAG: hypothetical protein SCH70_11320 [Candidatus Methanoperedens sp.]|nr:hypothetical protein [Candidatus Methanoperedens sp.]
MAAVQKRKEKFIHETQKLKNREKKQKESEKAQLKKLRSDGVRFSERLFTINGKPVSFVDFPYVKQVFSDSARIVVLLWARSMAKTTTIASIMAYRLATKAYTGAMAAAPRDKQAWRVTKEHIRPRFMDSTSSILLPLIGNKNTESEITFINGSHYLASGAWVTGNSLRGPHVNYGFADEMQDWTREAFEVFKEVVNLPPAQIFCGGTPKVKGSFFEELWLASDQKEWNGKEWIPTNPDADKTISGYHITQEFSPFVSKDELEQKRRTMSPRMFTNEVLAKFFAAGGVKPIPATALIPLLIRTPECETQFIEKTLGVDWGDETRWVLVGKTAQNKLYVIDSGVLDDVDSLRHVDKLSSIIAKEAPKWVMCDAGYGKTKNQMLMRDFPGRVWAVFTSGNAPLPHWDTITEIKSTNLQQDDWQYHVSINHTAMCENLENTVARQEINIFYFPEQQPRMDVFLYELSQADAEEATTATGRIRRFDISSAHSFAALAYALIPYFSESGNYGINTMTRAPRFARGPKFRQ